MESGYRWQIPRQFWFEGSVTGHQLLKVQKKPTTLSNIKNESLSLNGQGLWQIPYQLPKIGQGLLLTGHNAIKKSKQLSPYESSISI